MGKITVLSPIHIGSGNVYQSFQIHNNKCYEFTDLLSTTRDSLRFLDEKLANKLVNNANLSKKEFFESLNLQTEKLASKTPSYEIKNKTNMIDLIGNVNESIKNMSSQYIPGSSLKGYFLNVMWNDIILKNYDIKKYLSNVFEKFYQESTAGKSNPTKMKRYLDNLENEIKHIMQLFGVHDIIMPDAKIVLYKSNRYLNGKKTSKCLPVGLVEVIDVNESVEVEFLFSLVNNSKKYGDNVKQGVKIAVEQNRNRNGLSDREFEKENQIKNTILEEFYFRIVNFKTWFPKANKEFMALIIDKEIKFLDTIINKDINEFALRTFLTKIKNDLLKGEIIIQIGKFTNFFLKSYGSQLGELYHEYFIELFTPKRENKTVAKIDTMNLVEINGLGTLSFGFLRIDSF